MYTEVQLQLITNYEGITGLLMYTQALFQLIQIYEINEAFDVH